MIRFDGLYQSQEENFFLYLRFYEDGTVLALTADGDADQVYNLVEKDHPGASAGAYSLKEDAISFTTPGSDGLVDYAGEIQEDRLALRFHNREDGKQGFSEYRFVGVFPALFEGEPLYLRVRCTDALRFADGEFGDMEEWVFYLKAPSAWVYAPGLRERMVRLSARIYAGLNWRPELHPQSDDGTRLVLGDVETVILGEKEVARRTWRRQSLYVLQPGEAVRLELG
jgi:hypothetical protein